MKDSPTSFKELVRTSVKDSSNFESNEDYLKNTFKTISSSERHTISALSSQLKDLQSLFSLQQQEAMKTAEHIDMLNNVIDTLNETIKQQNNEISNLRQVNSVLKESLEKAEENKEHAHVERKTFIKLEEQTKKLFEIIKEKNLEIGDMKVELKYLREMKEDSLFVEEMKMKKLEENNISLPLENKKLKKKLATSEDLNETFRKKISYLEERVAELDMKLKYQENYTVESMAKINKLEYENILKLDKLFIESRDIEKREQELKRNIEVFKENNTELQSQLQESVNKIQLVESVCGNIIDNAEKVINEKKIEVNNLNYENKKLKIEIKMLREIIEKASQRGQYYILGDKNFYEYNSEDAKGINIEAPSLHKLPADMVNINHLSTTNFSQTQPNGQNISTPLSKIHPMTKFNSSNSGLEQKERGIFPIIDMLNAKQGLFFYDMKTQIIENYLKIFSSSLCLSTVFYTTSFLENNSQPLIFSKDFISGLAHSSKTINLSNCSILDQDIDILINCLRKIPSISLTYIEKIDLSNNQLTNDGVRSLFNWFVSLSSLELIGRKKKLEIDLQLNNIRLDPLGEIKSLFRIREEIYRVEFITTSDDTLVIFGENNPEKLSNNIIEREPDEEDIPDIDLENDNRVAILTTFNFNNQRGRKTARNPNSIGEIKL